MTYIVKQPIKHSSKGYYYILYTLNHNWFFILYTGDVTYDYINLNMEKV